MATKKYVEAVIAVILLIVLVFIAQLTVGVFGISASQVNNTLMTTMVAGGSCNGNTLSANYCGKIGLAVVQFGQVGGVTATIIPFITVIIVVALVVILLDLFGIDLGAYFRGMGGMGG